jgi:hypothetical protein
MAMLSQDWQKAIERLPGHRFNREAEGAAIDGQTP